MAEAQEQNKESNFVFFFGDSDIYSQFHPCKIEIDGLSYDCAEQYMMHQKAVVFKDEEMADKIMLENRPKEIKAFGRKVRNFDDEIWTGISRDVVFAGNYAKFNQNEEFKKILLETGDKIIAEASPFDRRWGIGLGKKNPKALNPKLWRGKNWLGEAIMKVREKLRQEVKDR